MVIVLAHWAEHLLQAFQIYVLGWPVPEARGLLGLYYPWLIKSETLHYGYALVMLAGLWMFRSGFHRRERSPLVDARARDPVLPSHRALPAASRRRRPATTSSAVRCRRASSSCGCRASSCTSSTTRSSSSRWSSGCTTTCFRRPKNPREVSVHVRVAPGGRGIDVLSVAGRRDAFSGGVTPEPRCSSFCCSLALAVVADGLLGARLDPTQLATVLTWVHYRGLLVVALLAAGNLFCTGCPFVLVRDAGRRIRPPRLAFPRWLRTKWIGVALFVAVLFCYELFDLWALPRATAWLVLAYFASALVVDPSSPAPPSASISARSVSSTSSPRRCRRSSCG